MFLKFLLPAHELTAKLSNNMGVSTSMDDPGSQQTYERVDEEQSGNSTSSDTKKETSNDPRCSDLDEYTGTVLDILV